MQIQERHLGELRTDLEDIWWVQYAPYGRSFAYRGKCGKLDHVVSNDGLGPGFSRVDTIAFDPQGLRLAYTACREEGPSDVVVVDGKTLGPFTGAWDPRFSPDSRLLHFEFRHKSELGWATYDASEEHVSRRILGRIPEGFELFTCPIFSPTGDRVAYSAWSYGGMALVIGNQVVRQAEYVDEPEFSEDGERIVCLIHEGNQESLWIDDEVIGPFEEITDFQSSPSGRTVGFIVKEAGKEWVRVGDRYKSEPFDKVGSMRVAEDGFAFSTVRGSKQAIVHNGLMQEEWDVVEPPCLFGGMLAYVGASGTPRRYFVLFGSQRWGPFDWVGPLVNHPKTGHVAFCVRKEDCHYVALNGSLLDPIETIVDLWFYPDGSALGYGCQVGRELRWRWVTL